MTPRYQPSRPEHPTEFYALWCYLYRAIDRDGNLVDVYLSETRDMAAAKAFLRSARSPASGETDKDLIMPFYMETSSASTTDFVTQ
jgi:hypothetical protein